MIKNVLRLILLSLMYSLLGLYVLFIVFSFIEKMNEKSEEQKIKERKNIEAFYECRQTISQEDWGECDSFIKDEYFGERPIYTPSPRGRSYE